MSARTARAAGLRVAWAEAAHGIWKILCNVRFAIMLVAVAAVACLVGVVIPQVPIPMRSNPAARAAWLDVRREHFGPFTDGMDGLGLFDIFYAPWFYALWALIIVAVTVCTVSRFRPTARSVRHPQVVVPDRYFQSAHHRADFAHPGGWEDVEAALRKRRFSVQRTRTDGETTYLFAQRYQWAAYGTFVSHLALLMVLVGGVLTVLTGFSRMMVVAETAGPAPVFARPGPGQMFVEVKEAHRGLDDAGNIIDFRTAIEVRRGADVVSCTTTVNDPCSAFGYRIHQAAWFDDIARLRIVDPDGRTVFNQTMDFESRATRVPFVVFTGTDGAVRYEGPLPQLGAEEGTEGNAVVGFSALPTLSAADEPAGGRLDYLVAWRTVEGTFQVVVSGADLEPVEIEPGQEIDLPNGVLRYAGSTSVPAMRIADMPGAPDGAVAQMVDTANGTVLVLSGVAGESVILRTDMSHTTTAGFTYEFGGRVAASGLDVRRDPGSLFIWIAVAMALTGLGATFYVPRRRIWIKVSPERTYAAGIAVRHVPLGAELRELGVSLGATAADYCET